MSRTARSPSPEIAAAERRLQAARRRAEDTLATVRTAIAGEVGAAPRKRYLLLLLTAGAVGFALALRRRRSKRLGKR
jgi:hypothetical protein